MQSKLCKLFLLSPSSSRRVLISLAFATRFLPRGVCSTNEHGEMAPQCGDAFLLYGKALLYNAIAQSAVLGGGPEGQSKQETEQAVRESTLPCRWRWSYS